MNLNSFVNSALKVVEDILLGLKAGIKWRRVKKLIRKHIWKPYLLPAIKNQDFGWVDEALFFLVLVKLLWNQFANAPESLKKSGISHRSMLKDLANR